jgi:replication factor A2
MAYNAMGFAGRGPQQAGGGAKPQGGSGGDARKTPMHPIRSVTIKQLLNANRVGDGVTVIDGREATQVTVCGRVLEHENGAAATAMTAKHVGYRISDGTGTMVVRQWADQGGAPQEVVPTGQFVRCSGSVKVWMDSPLVTGTVRIIFDANEFTYHLLESALTHLRISLGSRRRSSSAGAAPGAANAASAAGAAAATGMGGADAGGKIICTEAVLRSIRNSGRKDLGLSVDEISSGVARHGFSATDVRTALRSLCAEGKVFLSGENRYAM